MKTFYKSILTIVIMIMGGCVVFLIIYKGSLGFVYI